MAVTLAKWLEIGADKIDWVMTHLTVVTPLMRKAAAALRNLAGSR